MIDHDRVLECVRDPAQAREVLHWLHALDPHDWTRYELAWMEEQLRRPPGYRFSDKEQAVLVGLHRGAKGYTQYRHYTIRQWIEIVHSRRGDLRRDQADVVTDWHQRGVTTLRQRQVEDLIAILRSFGEVDKAA